MTNILNALSQAVGLQLIPASVNTSTATGTGVDVSDYDGIAVAVLDSAAATGTDPTMNVKLQSCATVGGAYEDIADAVFTEVDDTVGGSHQVLAFNVAEPLAFVRGLATIAGTTPSFTFSLTFLGMKKAS